MITRAYARKEAEPRVKPKNTSTKILGFGISMVGVVMLSIALIMGLEFPSFVHERVVEDICVTGPDHKFFKKWRLEEDWVRYNKLYYWVVENPNEFLFHGQPPSFSEQGPYIYRETRHKIDPVFDGYEVSFYNEINQTFEAALTQKECGVNCTENDQLTVFNLEYLRLIKSMDNLDNVIYNKMPDVIKDILQNTSTVQTVHNDDLYAFLGCLSIICENQTTRNYSNEQFPYDISIGFFIQQNDSWYKTFVLEDRAWQSFPSTEMSNFYDNLQNKGSLGVESELLTNKPQVIKCTNFALKNLCNATDLETFSNYNESFDDFQDFSTFHQSCGLIYILIAVADVGCFSNVTSDLVKYINDVTGVVWLNVTNNNYANTSQMTILSEAYILLLKDFILTKIFNLVYHKVFPDGYPSIIQKKNQKQIVLGYMNEGLYIDGTSANHVHRPIWKLSTCLENRNRDNNMVVREFNGSQFAPQVLFPGGFQSGKYSGITKYAPLVSDYVTCEAPSPHKESDSIFVEDLYRDVLFSKPTKTELYGTTVYKFVLDEMVYNYAYSFDINCTIQMMSDVYQFPSWISNPHFYGCNRNNPYLLNTNPSLTSYVSTVEIEPKTGQIWGQNIRLQTNIFLDPEYVQTRNLNPFNISSLHNLYPVYWIERTAQITAPESEYFKEKVIQLLDVSCGGLIGFSIVAILTVILSAFVAFLPHRSNRNKVAPSPVIEDSHAIHNSTHP